MKKQYPKTLRKKNNNPYPIESDTNVKWQKWQGKQTRNYLYDK